MIDTYDIEDALAGASSALRELGMTVRVHHVVRVEISDQVAVGVYDLLPAEIDRVEAAHPDADAHRDLDGILRWVDVEVEGVQVTFYRR